MKLYILLSLVPVVMLTGMEDTPPNRRFIGISNREFEQYPDWYSYPNNWKKFSDNEKEAFFDKANEQAHQLHDACESFKTFDDYKKCIQKEVTASKEKGAELKVAANILIGRREKRLPWYIQLKNKGERNIRRNISKIVQMYHKYVN